MVKTETFSRHLHNYFGFNFYLTISQTFYSDFPPHFQGTQLWERKTWLVICIKRGLMQWTWQCLKTNHTSILSKIFAESPSFYRSVNKGIKWFINSTQKKKTKTKQQPCNWACSYPERGWYPIDHIMYYLGQETPLFYSLLSVTRQETWRQLVSSELPVLFCYTAKVITLLSIQRN